MILPKRNWLFNANIMSGEEEYTRRQASQCKVAMSIFIDHIIVSISQNLKYSFPPPELSTTPLVQLRKIANQVSQNLTYYFLLYSAYSNLAHLILRNQRNAGRGPAWARAVIITIIIITIVTIITIIAMILFNHGSAGRGQAWARAGTQWTMT